MTDEIIAEDSLAQEVDAPESEAAEENEVETLDDAGDEQLTDEDSQDEPADDSEEIEFNERQYKLPKDIAEGVKSMRKDYTEKTMAVAEQRRALDAKTQFFDTFATEATQLMSINNQLKEFKQLDWNTLFQNDSTLANQLQRKERELLDQRAELGQQVTTKQQQLQHDEQQTLAKAIESSEAVLRREIKEWSPELESKLKKYAMDTFGFDAEDVAKSKADPRIYKLLHKAFVGDQLRNTKLPKPKAEAHQASTVTVLKGKGSVVKKSPSQMNDTEFEAYRRKVIQSRR